jgi:hypothetical protein
LRERGSAQHPTAVAASTDGSTVKLRRISDTTTVDEPPPRRYDAEQLRRFSDTTIAYYDRFARAFWNGTRDYAAFLDAIEGDPPYSILDLGCGPGRDLSVRLRIV